MANKVKKKPSGKRERKKPSGKRRKKKLTSSEKKSIWITFTLLFPSLILTVIITTLPRSLEISMISTLLFFYQAILLKNFVENYYKVKH